MKKIKIFSAFLAVTLLMSSCEKNFDPKIYGQLFSSNFPKTEADYEAYMMICYMPFNATWGCQLTGSNQQSFDCSNEQGRVRLFDATADYCAPWLVYNWGGGAWLQLTQANYNECHLYGSWDSNWDKVKYITRQTEVIGVLEKATELSATKKRNLIGEARLLRGLTMYYMFHIFGPIPVIIDPELVGNVEAEKNMERPTLDQMTEYITADFEFAVANMANTGPKGRYTADFARFCLMRHYLNEGYHMTGYYDKAIEMYNALKTSGYGLFTAGSNPYADQFKMANKFNKEVIMAVSTSASADGADGNGNFNPISYYLIPPDAAKYADIANTIPTPFVFQGGGWGQCFNVAPAYYNTYEAGDLRRDVILPSYIKNDDARTNITVADIGVKWSGFILNKYPVEIDNYFQPTDIPLARWADVLLLYAEAVARKTNAVPTGEALQGVNDVRARAELAPLSGAAVADYNGFMNALLAERGHELLYEGCRKIDLIRFNKYRHNCTLIKGVAPTHQYMPIPDYVFLQADGLTQTFSRPDWDSDN